MWVQLALVACYVPFGIEAVLDVNGIENDVAWITAETLVYVYKLISKPDPVLLKDERGQASCKRHNKKA